VKRIILSLCKAHNIGIVYQHFCKFYAVFINLGDIKRSKEKSFCSLIRRFKLPIVIQKIHSVKRSAEQFVLFEVWQKQVDRHGVLTTYSSRAIYTI